MGINKFLLENYTTIVALIGILSMTYIVVKNSTNKQIASLIISLMTDAEINLGSGTGVLKKQYVLSKLPLLFKLLYKTEHIQMLIDEYAFEYGKILSKINENLGGTKHE